MRTSALGQKRTFQRLGVFVRFVPKAEVVLCAGNAENGR
jgi:hypothetical protein